MGGLGQRVRLEWTGDEPVMPDEITDVPARRTYRRWPWDQWASGVEHKFAGEHGGKTPRAMANFWRAWAKRHGKTCHAYVGCGAEGEYVLLSMSDYDPDHKPEQCDQCGDEDSRYGQ